MCSNLDDWTDIQQHYVLQHLTANTTSIIVSYVYMLNVLFVICYNYVHYNSHFLHALLYFQLTRLFSFNLRHCKERVSYLAAPSLFHLNAMSQSNILLKLLFAPTHKKLITSTQSHTVSNLESVGMYDHQLTLWFGNYTEVQTSIIRG